MNAILDFEMGKALRELALVLRHKWEGDAEIGAYLKALSDLSASAVTAACEDLARTERFMPRPAKVRLRVEHLQRKASAPAVTVSADVLRDPTTGEVVRVFRCMECLDTGWLTGFPLVRPGADPTVLARYTGARRCGCGRLAEPKRRVFEGQGEQWQDER